MPRADLLALTFDDLAAITNRGTVKRAERELDERSVTCEISEDGDELVVRWSDGIVCRFPAGRTMHEASCSSGHVGVSRHVVRSVLAYQRHRRTEASSAAANPAPASASPTAVPPSDSGDTSADLQSAGVSPELPTGGGEPTAWDPGTITDEALVAQFRSSAIAKARQRFEAGVLVELLRGVKPVARFLDAACTLRFLVPGDVRYVTADCDDAQLATYVALAVWAFRRLPPDRTAGLVVHQLAEFAVPHEPLAELQSLLQELGLDGLAGCGPTWVQRLTRLEATLRAAGLVWPAELVADLLAQQALYQAHDARFDPTEVVDVLGELLARSRAIACGTREVPQLLIRGSASDRVTEIAGGRSIGLGMGVVQGKRVTTLSAFLQDSDTGTVSVIERTFADPAPDSGDAPKDYSVLAETVLSRGVSLGSLARAQLLLKSGKRTPSGRLVLPRTAGSLTINPQAFAWEQLKPPVAVEDFSQVEARLRMMPPSYLRPRRLADNLCVCPVEAAEEVRFDESRQRLEAVVRDRACGRALLLHSYHSRSRAGFERLFATLVSQRDALRYVCGQVTWENAGLVLRPIAAVFDDGTRRTAVLPYIDAAGEASDSARTGDRASAPARAAQPGVELAGDSAPDPLAEYVTQLRSELAELLLTGVRRARGDEARRWEYLSEHGRRLGFVRLAAPPEQLAEMLASRAQVFRWDAAPATRVALELCLLARISREV